MCTLNVHSVKKKLDAIQDIIMEFNSDVLALSQNWLSDQEKDQFFITGLTISGYDFVNIPRPDSTGYGGVGFLSIVGLNMSVHSNYKYSSFESLVAKFHVGSRNLYISLSYRPPPSSRNNSSTARLFQEFSDFLSGQSIDTGNKLIMGDFNFHLYVPEDRNAAKVWKYQ